MIIVRVEPLKAATQAHTDLHTFATVVAILEGGLLHTAKSQSAASKIIWLCQAEQQRPLREYDKAVANATGGPTVNRGDQ